VQSNAQVAPNGILFQAVARDANNNAASNRNVYAIVNILEGSSTGLTCRRGISNDCIFSLSSSSVGFFGLIFFDKNGDKRPNLENFESDESYDIIEFIPKYKKKTNKIVKINILE
jgi:hypothetical protein